MVGGYSLGEVKMVKVLAKADWTSQVRIANPTKKFVSRIAEGVGMVHQIWAKFRVHYDFRRAGDQESQVCLLSGVRDRGNLRRIMYLALVVHSDAHDERRQKKVDKQIAKEWEGLDQSRK
jgi:hypothetical protein